MPKENTVTSNWIKQEFNLNDLRLMHKLAEHIKIFRNLTPAEISELLARAEKCTYQPGTTIIKEGSVGAYMYVIFDGTALVTKKGNDGDVELARLNAADSFGEMALADREARCATVTAMTTCVLVRLGEPILIRSPEVAMKVYRNITILLSERLRRTDEKLVWQL